MRILFVGHRNPSYATITEFMESAFITEGHEVTFLEYRDWALPGRIVGWSGIAAAWEGGRLRRRLLEAVRSCRPDLLFVNYGEVLPPGAVREAASLSGAITVLWLTDFPGDGTYHRRVLDLAPAFDLVAAQGNDMCKVLLRRRNIRAHWLPAAADPSFHRPVGTPAGAVMNFVGSYYPRRERLLRGLEGMDLLVHGPGWEHSRPWPGALIRAGGVPAADACGIYAGSAISLSIHHMGAWDDVRFAQVSPRVFEIAACGGFLMSDRPSDLRLLMEEGEHFIGFDDPGELREAARKWLADEAGRRKIAERAAAHVAARHTYVHRVRELMRLVEGRDG